MIIILIDLLSPNLIRGYDLVITITISFNGPNNLEDLIYGLREDKRRDQSVNYNPPIDFTKLLNWIKIMLVEWAPSSITLINLNGWVNLNYLAI